MALVAGFPVYDPRGLTFERWASLLAEALSEYNIPNPADEDSWFGWACTLFGAPDLVSLGLPDPRGFTGWREWAETLVQGLNT